MSIYAYVGLPGSGKTYDVVANQLLPALKSGRKVVTNVPLHREVVLQHCPDADLQEFPIEQVLQEPGLIETYAKPGTLVVIDECWRLWPAGQKAHQVPEPFRKFLAEHRHMVNEAGDSTQIVLVTQDLAQIAAFARQLVEQTYFHTKLTHVGSSGSYRIDVYQGGPTGLNPPRSARLREIFGRYSKEVFALYKSHTMSASGKAGANERAVDKRGNIWRRPMIWVAAAGVLIAFVWGGRAAWSVFHEPGSEPAARASGATAGSPARAAGFRFPSSGSTAARTAASGPAAASTWRVTGVIVFGDRAASSVALLSNGVDALSLPLRRFCLKDRELDWVCRFQGKRYSRWGGVSDEGLQEPRLEPALATPTGPSDRRSTGLGAASASHVGPRLPAHHSAVASAH